VTEAIEHLDPGARSFSRAATHLFSPDVMVLGGEHGEVSALAAAGSVRPSSAIPGCAAE
jgi:hypothetical protein